MDPRVTELQCIMPLENIPSVLQRGVLCFELASQLQHTSVAMAPVQDRRQEKKVPGGLRLHQYANVYFHARNPMLFVRRFEDVCVLRVSKSVLSKQGTVITDQNAASDYVRFLAPSQWHLLDFEDIYAVDWKHPDDQIREWRHKSRKCAEALVPHTIEPAYIVGAYVPDDACQARLAAQSFDRPITIDPEFFFREQQ